MKLKIISDFGRLKADTDVEIDSIRFDPKYAGAFAVRVSGVWSRPRWFAISWFVEMPKGVEWNLQAIARLTTEKRKVK